MTGDPVLDVRDTRTDELERIAAIERDAGDGFVLPYTLERHREEIARHDVRYKSFHRDGELVGFAILVLDADARSVEFRRIVLADAGRGLGKEAVAMVGELCRSELGAERVWLDVFETNARARRVYEACGYEVFGESEHEGRALLLYDVAL